MCCDCLALFFRIDLKCLTNFLVVASIPSEESAIKQALLFDALLFSEIDSLNTSKVAAVLRLKLFLDEFLKTIWIVEETIVLYNLQLFALRIF